MPIQNGTMFQYFSWDLPDNGELWNWLKESADHLRSLGITGVWIPPAYKSNDDGPENRVGYGVYDHFDLGEFPQKNNRNSDAHPTRTKYGTKQELHNAIHALHGFGYSDGNPRAYIQVYADIVMNHKFGADEQETIVVFPIGNVHNDDIFSNWLSNRNNPGVKSPQDIWTKFDFTNRLSTQRGREYSDFTWNSNHFDAVVDGSNQGYMIDGRSLDWQVSLNDRRLSNYDVLMGADLDFDNGFVRGEMKKWGTWFVEEMGFDGFRIDANKHIRFSFIREFLGHVRHEIGSRYGKNLFSVSEYLSGNRDELERYLDAIGNPSIDGNNPPAQVTNLFDFPLREHFKEASISYNGAYQIHRLQEGALIENSSEYAVTFVENHDTEEVRGNGNVGEWFKHIAYAYILLRGIGYPCVFYGDYFSNQREFLDLFLRLRRSYATGEEWYFAINHLNTKDDAIGWVRPYSSNGSMVIGINNSQDRWHEIRMDSGRSLKEFYHYATISWIEDSRHVIDYSWDRYGGSTYTSDSGWANFKVSPRSVTIWLEEGTWP